MSFRRTSATLPIVLALALGAGRASADEIRWSNINGGSFHLGANWTGGFTPGTADIARFGRTRDADQQLAYTVSFGSSPSNRATVIERDRVTFDLNANAYLLTNVDIAMLVGTTSTGSGRLTIVDGVVATTTPDAIVGIGGSTNSPGFLTVSTGGQLLGASVNVGYSGPGTLLVQNGGDVVGGPMFVGSQVAFGVPGTATISGAGSAVVAEEFTVGDLGPGTMHVLSGARVESTAVILGNSGGILGTVNVDGAGSQWTGSSVISIGDRGRGVLNISGGARVRCREARAGVASGSAGTINVSGGAELTTEVSCLVGREGAGTMNVFGGGVVHCAFGAVGNAAPARVAIDGAGSRWNCTGTISVRSFVGGAALAISGGGEVVSAEGSVITDVGSPASVDMTGAGSRWAMTGDLSVAAEMNVTEGAEVDVANVNLAMFSESVGAMTLWGPGSRCRVTESLTVGGRVSTDQTGGAGALTIGPGATVTAFGLYICRQGSVELVGGTLDAYVIDLAFFPGGRFAFLGGVLNVNLFGFDLVNRGGTLTPGADSDVTEILGSYTQMAAGALGIEIGGIPGDARFDKIVVYDAVSLGGTLAVRLVNGYVPAPHEAFAVLRSEGISGAFANAPSGTRLEVPGGGSFAVHYGPGSPFDPTQVVLSDFSSCPADFNGDGFLDFFDYDDYVNCFETAVCPPGRTADFNGDSFADFFDYDDFVAAFEVGC